MIKHSILSQSEILKNFLSNSAEEFKILQNSQNKKKNDSNANKDSSISEINKLYEYAQAYLKNTFNTTLLKNKPYESTEIDILMEKTKKFEEACIKLNIHLESLAKIHKNSSSNSPKNLYEIEDKNDFDSLEKWNKSMKTEKNFFDVFEMILIKTLMLIKRRTR